MSTLGFLQNSSQTQPQGVLGANVVFLVLLYVRPSAHRRAAFGFAHKHCVLRPARSRVAVGFATFW